MKFLADPVLARLRASATEPDLSATKYRLVERLGRGGMASVWLVEDTELGREVALKVTDDVDASGDIARRLRREAQVIARLEHPAIVPVHDVGALPDGRAYYAMKRVRGQRLDAWLATRPPRAAALRLFQRACEAVAFAHAAGVIHRDLKPQNIMVGAFGEALIMDWGLAKALRGEGHTDTDTDTHAGTDTDTGTDTGTDTDTDTHAGTQTDTDADTAAGTVMGTPAYMAPEQARAETERVDARSDVWALGALLYFVLAGHEPFQGASTGAVLRAVTEAEPAPLEAVRPPVPAPLRSIVARALRKSPPDRYPSAREMADDVGRFLDGLAVAAHRETALETGARLARRYQVVLLLLLAYLAMRVVVLAFFRR
jgi:serine/threonine protein kinase